MKTPEAVLSWPELFVPKSQNEGEKARYSATLVFLEDADLGEMKAEAMDALLEKFPKLNKASAKKLIKSGSLGWPFHNDADKVEKKGYPEGSTYLNVKTFKRPGIVTQYADPVTGKPMAIQSPDEASYGTIVMASVAVNAYDKKGNKGVSFWLNNLQVRGRSDILGGGTAAEDDFEADAPLADLDDIGGEEAEADAPVTEDLDALLS